ncbi:MAG: T9SS type A sorting domain-containing protein, partial [Saprospiraceae bacterium]|nr:T9SS type A sorting domain-containing protein [Saprospiraceae bacterium]
APDMPYPCPDMSKLFYASDLAQCFIDGCIGDLTRASDAPDMDFLALDREIVGLLSNEPAGGNSNNSLEDNSYVKSCDFGIGDNKYRFEGYLVYQLAEPDSRLDSLNDPKHARLVFRTDIKNGVKSVYNWNLINTPAGNFYQPELKVEGSDQGLQHSFKLTEDAFAEGDDKRLINHKTYCFTVLAYDYNQFLPFDPTTLMGQKTEYMQSHQNVKVYCATPRPILDQTLNAAYGDDLAITRIEGVGVGGNFVDMDDASLQRILDGSFTGEIGYRQGRGPITAKVYNPFNLVDGEYEITFEDDDLTNNELGSNVRWKLQKLNSNDPAIPSDHTIEVLNEQFFAQYGFAITIGQTMDAGDCSTANVGAIGTENAYADPAGPQWFSAIQNGYDVNLPGPFYQLFNYIKPFFSADCDFAPLAQLGNGHFVPYQLCQWEAPLNQFILSPAWRSSLNSLVVKEDTYLKELNNVDIVFTPDKSLWSRCVVVETMSEDYANLGFAEQGGNVTSVGSTAGSPILSFDLRKSPSVGKEDTNGDGVPEPDGDGFGMGWFPGYAIDVETGKRLNIFFGENSAFSAQNGFLDKYPNNKPNGGDMLFNPNDQLLLDGVYEYNLMRYYAGGQHFVYVTNEEYDGCQYLRERFDASEGSLKKVNGLKDITWASLAFLEAGESLLPLDEGLIPNEYKVKLRVDNPYQVAVGTGEQNGYPTYRFKVEGLNAVPHETPELKSALSQINVVPNPFYFPHGYTGEAGTGVVKFTNLPARCTVTVYTLSGNVVRIFERNEQPGQPNGSAIEETQIAPDLEWNVTSSNGKQLATGIYLIHIKAPGIGERTLKLVVV